MKKLFLIILAVIGFSVANAQVVDKAIGFRFGGWNGYGGEFSYQHPLSSKTRLEANLALGFHDDWNTVGLTGLHEWVMNIENGFQWYVGLGGSLGSSSYHVGSKGSPGYVSGNEFFLSVDGDIGIEYCFKEVPLQIALDLRPAIGVMGNDYVDNASLGLAIRYRF